MGELKSYSDIFNKEKEWLFCIQEEIETFKLQPEASAIIQYDFMGESIFVFLNTGFNNGGFILNAHCEPICLGVCFLCAFSGECEGEVFSAEIKNQREVWRR